jgi:hypothetical protein
MSPQPDAGPFTIELTQEEILEDLCWPHAPPGQWSLEPRREPDAAPTEKPLELGERALRPPRAA